MRTQSKDDGAIAVLVRRFSSRRLPRALPLMEKLENAEQVGRLVDRHPKFVGLMSRATSHYKETTEKVLDNEKNAPQRLAGLPCRARD
jgi:hypothetical protein